MIIIKFKIMIMLTCPFLRPRVHPPEQSGQSCAMSILLQNFKKLPQGKHENCDNLDSLIEQKGFLLRTNVDKSFKLEKFIQQKSFTSFENSLQGGWNLTNFLVFFKLFTLLPPKSFTRILPFLPPKSFTRIYP